MSYYSYLMKRIEDPVARYLLALFFGIVLLVPIMIWSVLCVIGTTISQCLIVNPIDAYKGDFE